MFTATLINKNGTCIGKYDGYVPEWMPGEHYGDYVELDIDMETGVITNWKNPSVKELIKTFDVY
jgi:hypothetical protein